MTFDWTPTGSIARETAAAPLAGAAWHHAEAEGAGFTCRFVAGALAGQTFLTADFLLDGADAVVFRIDLAEGEKGPVFGVWFSLLNQCEARMRLPLNLSDLHTRNYPREGAWKNVICIGERVDLRRVDRAAFYVTRKAPGSVRWCMTPITAVTEAPSLLADPLLPKGILIDEVGQATWREWPGKSRNLDEVVARLRRQRDEAPQARWPAAFSRWGGWREERFEATGFFRTQHDGRRWWLVDPDGHPFWSTGPDCVGIGCQAAYEGLERAHAWLPPSDGPFAEAFSRGGAWAGFKREFSFLCANLIRAFGRDYRAAWETVAAAEMRRIGFNSCGNWSDWQAAGRQRFPYVRQIEPCFPNTPLLFRDMPDVFHPAFAGDCAASAESLRASAEDAALIGYFLMNEPQWGFVGEPLAQHMLLAAAPSAAREAFARHLSARYATDAALAGAWRTPGLTFQAVAHGPWCFPFTPEAVPDLEQFSTVLVARFFDTLGGACRAVDPRHLNLGGRYYTVPPAWAQRGMTSFDVIGVNGYSQRVRRELGPFSEAMGKPVIIGEWHFGALDAGLPMSGIGHVRSQADRGRAYRNYLEDAAAQPWCVGAHWFTLYDEPAQGRFDGENYNIGFLDVCHRPYGEFAGAARAAHERLYDVAAGRVAPYDEPVEHLPLLF